MPHVVTAARDAVRNALEVELMDVAWTKRHWLRPEAKALPRGTVTTPEVQTEWFTKQQVARSVTVRVSVKREGGDDLDDVLDVDSARVEVAVLPVLEALSHEYGLTRTATDIDPGANVPVGELTMLFTVLLVTAEGVPNV